MNDNYLPRHDAPWNQQRDLDWIAERIGSGDPYHGRHRAEDQPAGRHRAPEPAEPAEVDDEGLRDAHLDLFSLPLTHGQMSEGWAISSRHHTPETDTAATGS